MESFNWNTVYTETQLKMEKALDALKKDFLTIRAGNATPSMLDSIMVNVYGAMMPINQLASVSAPEPRLLTVSVWDKSNVNLIDKAIRESALGLNPSVDGTLLRIAIPPLSEERRKEFVKTVKGFGENCKVSIRSVRQKSMDLIKTAEKDKMISETDMHVYQTDIQKLTDKFSEQSESLVASKETDIMKI